MPNSLSLRTAHPESMLPSVQAVADRYRRGIPDAHKVARAWTHCITLRAAFGASSAQLGSSAPGSPCVDVDGAVG